MLGNMWTVQDVRHGIILYSVCRVNHIDVTAIGYSRDSTVQSSRKFNSMQSDGVNAIHHQKQMLGFFFTF